MKPKERADWLHSYYPGADVSQPAILNKRALWQFFGCDKHTLEEEYSMAEAAEAFHVLKVEGEIAGRAAKKRDKPGVSAADYDDPWASRRDDMDDG